MPVDHPEHDLGDVWRYLGSLLPPSIEAPASGLKRYWYWSVLTALVVAATYVVLVVNLDNTNVGTSNGLWKSVDVRAWKQGIDGQIDNGGLLYAAVYGHLAALIPEAMLRYGAPAPDVTFRQMAILNAIFGGIASGLVFFLALRFTGSPRAAAVIAFIHATSGYVLLNSLNSEDIIPAYALFLAAMVCFLEFLYWGGIPLFAGSALLLAVATLFHWTLLIPGLAAIGAVYAFLMLKDRKFAAMGTAWLLLLFCWLKVVTSVAFPAREIPLWSVLYPHKAEGMGWVGLVPQKGWYLLVGIGNYFCGAENVSEYRAAFHLTRTVITMTLSWLVLGAALAACLYALAKRTAKPALNVLAVAAIALFGIGEFGALFSQPQDPQMQLQPLLIIPFGLILTGALWRRAIPAALVVVAAANGIWNFGDLAIYRGDDSKALAAIGEIDRLFPKAQTAIVAQGFETWVAWQYVLLRPGDYMLFTEKSVLLSVPFSTQRGITAAAAAAQVEKQIDDARAQGLRVIASPVWTESEEHVASSLASVTSEDNARAYLALLKQRYHIGEKWNTPLGTFVELLPAGS